MLTQTATAMIRRSRRMSKIAFPLGPLITVPFSRRSPTWRVFALPMSPTTRVLSRTFLRQLLWCPLLRLPRHPQAPLLLLLLEAFRQQPALREPPHPPPPTALSRQLASPRPSPFRLHMPLVLQQALRFHHPLQPLSLIPKSPSLRSRSRLPLLPRQVPPPKLPALD